MTCTGIGRCMNIEEMHGGGDCSTPTDKDLSLLPIRFLGFGAGAALPPTPQSRLKLRHTDDSMSAEKTLHHSRFVGASPVMTSGFSPIPIGESGGSPDASNAYMGSPWTGSMDTSHSHSPQNSPSDTASYSSRRRIAKDRRDSFTFEGIKMELDVSAVGYDKYDKHPDKYDKHPKLSPIGATVSAIGHRKPPAPLQIPHFQRLQPGSLVCSPHPDECDLTPSDAGGVTPSDAKANGNDFPNSTRGQQFGSPNLRQVERRPSFGGVSASSPRLMARSNSGNFHIHIPNIPNVPNMGFNASGAGSPPIPIPNMGFQSHPNMGFQSSGARSPNMGFGSFRDLQQLQQQAMLQSEAARPPSFGGIKAYERASEDWRHDSTDVDFSVRTPPLFVDVHTFGDDRANASGEMDVDACDTPCETPTGQDSGHAAWTVPVAPAERQGGTGARSRCARLTRQSSLYTKKDYTEFLLGRCASELTYDSHYECMQLLGRGDFGEVWQAVHHETCELFALKKSTRTFRGQSDRKAFLREIDAMRRIAPGQHPNIVRYHRAWQDNGYFFIVMELCSEGTLRSLLDLHADEGTCISVDSIVHIATGLMNGLNHIHSANFLHLDLKPENLFLSTEHGIKIGDFGLVVENGKWEDEEGDRRYLAPELLQGQADFKADIFAAGLIVYQMLMGLQDLPGNDDEWQALRRPPPYQKIVQPRSPEHAQLAQVVTCMIHPEPSNRPSAADLISDTAPEGHQQQQCHWP